MTEAIFRSSSAVDGAPGYRERTGETVIVLGEVEAEADPDKADDVAPLYRVRFPDGVETEAFEDELVVDETIDAS
jgi:hypothetical protein